MSANDTGKTVYFSLDLDNLPAPTPEELAMLKRLDDMPDEEIDFSDAPRVTDFSRFQSYPNLQEVRKQRLKESAAKAAREQAGQETSERTPVIAADILQFFQEEGGGPQRIDAILREYIAAHRKVA